MKERQKRKIRYSSVKEAKTINVFFTLQSKKRRK